MYLVQGCGVSLICDKGHIMTEWIDYIIQRGGVPKVQPLTSEFTNLQAVA
jgi:hypothetical protein